MITSLPSNVPKSNSKIIFPANGVPKHHVSRSKFVDQIVNNIISSNESQYIRGPRGSGKTVLLKLIGEKLKNYGDVYWISTASNLPELGGTWPLEELVSKSNGKMVYFLIDEAHSSKATDDPRWMYLLKEKPDNVVTIAAGIENFKCSSADFENSYPSSGLLATSDDLSELALFWSKCGIQAEVISSALNYLLKFTGGHFYPLLALSEHFFNVKSLTLHHVKKFLNSDEFFRSNIFKRIHTRCYQSLDSSIKLAATELFECRLSKASLDNLEKIGYWDNNKSQLLSQLLVYVLFGLSKPVESSILIGKYDSTRLESLRKSLALPDDQLMHLLDVEKIIITGLKKMETRDFYEPNERNFVYENPIGFRWARYAQSKISNINMLPQTQATKNRDFEEGPGAKPTIDFYVNGNLNTAFELARNCDQRSIDSKFSRFLDVNGAHSQWRERFCIFHFQLSGSTVTLPSKYNNYRHLLYSYLMEENVLYCGDKILYKRVCPTLPNRLPGNSMKNFNKKNFSTSIPRVISDLAFPNFALAFKLIRLF